MDLSVELAPYDALGLSELIAKKELQPAEVLEAFIERCERLNPAINAVVTKMYEEARRFVASEMPLVGPFRGVPFLLKDFKALYKGVPTTNGSRFFADDVASEDSDMVVRHKQAGFVIFGKTNTPELASNVSTEPVLFGPTLNPWNRERIAGGSSGGAAAAVAAGIVPLAHATDGGGSIRIPASCCGVFGFKPTRGRNPAGPNYQNALLNAEHGISRTVRDSAALLDATAGARIGDPFWAPPQTGPYQDEVATEPGPLKIAFSAVARSGAPVDPVCVRALEDAAHLCEELGHHVEEAALAYDGPGLGAAVRSIIGASAMASIRERSEALGRPPGPGDLELVIKDRVKLGDQATATDYALAFDTVHRTARQVGAFFDRYDVFITPTVAKPPPLLGTFDTNTTDVQAWLDQLWGFIPFTAVFNATGQPAMSVPLFWSDDGLPIGVQFAARFGGEAGLFRLAGQLERARPWAHRWPDLSTGA
jgi:amidase